MARKQIQAKRSAETSRSYDAHTEQAKDVAVQEAQRQAAAEHAGNVAVNSAQEDLLNEIDALLEETAENAAEFVRAYVQKGGE